VLAVGALKTQHSFGKEPFHRTHLFGGSYATSTGGIRLNYRCIAKEVIEDWQETAYIRTILRRPNQNPPNRGPRRLSARMRNN
jgi:hypothetical protein